MFYMHPNNQKKINLEIFFPHLKSVLIKLHFYCSRSTTMLGCSERTHCSKLSRNILISGLFLIINASSHTLMSASHTLMSASHCEYVHASIILPCKLQIMHLQRVYYSCHLIHVRHGSPENIACFFTPDVPLKFVGRRLTHSSQLICSSKEKKKGLCIDIFL